MTNTIDSTGLTVIVKIAVDHDHDAVVSAITLTALHSTKTLHEKEAVRQDR